MKKIFFVSGLPRSGSTLLMNLLGQNPNHYVTPTSGLIELFLNPTITWKNIIEFQAEGLDKIKPRIPCVMRGIMEGYYSKEFADGKIVFDKSRGWLQYIELIEQALEHEIRVVVTIRDIRAIVASFEKLYRNRGVDYTTLQGSDFFKQQTVGGRIEALLADSGMVGLAINRLRDAIMRLPNRLVIVPYRNLTWDPQSVMQELHENLGLEPYVYDPGNIQQVTQENDIVHGFDLHKIRPHIKPQDGIPWEGILTPDAAARIEQQFADINKLC